MFAQHSELGMEQNGTSPSDYGKVVILCHPNIEFLFTLILLPFHLVSFYKKNILAGFHNISVHPRCPCLRCPRYIYPICLSRNNSVCFPVHCLAFNAFAKSEIGVTIRVLFLTTWCMNFSPQLALIKTRFTRETNTTYAACIFHPTLEIRLGVQ